METPSKAELLKLVDTQQRRLEAQAQEIKLLRQKIDLLARRIFGKSSEKLDAGQLELLLKLHEGETTPGKPEASPILGEAASPHPQATKRRRFDRKERWPADLPVVEEVVDPDEVKQAPEAWRQIGEEVSEQLDFEPARFFRRRLVRRKYVPRKAVNGWRPKKVESAKTASS